MPDKNIFTAASERLAERMAAIEKDTAKSKVVPFGMQPVSADVEAKAFAGMNREGKAKFMEQHATKDDPKGIEYTMKVVQRGQKNA